MARYVGIDRDGDLSIDKGLCLTGPLDPRPFLVYQLISHFLLYLLNYKEFEGEILDLQSEKYGLSFDIKKCNTSGWALGDENVIGTRAFNLLKCYLLLYWLTEQKKKSIVICIQEKMQKVLMCMWMCNIFVQVLFCITWVMFSNSWALRLVDLCT